MMHALRVLGFVFMTNLFIWSLTFFVRYYLVIVKEFLLIYFKSYTTKLEPAFVPVSFSLMVTTFSLLLTTEKFNFWLITLSYACHFLKKISSIAAYLPKY